MDSLKVGHFKIEGLYLKLDNRFTLRIKKITIPKANNPEQLTDIDPLLRKVKRVLTFFEYIELESIHFTDDTYRVIYADDTLYIDNNQYEIAALIRPQYGGLVAKIPLIRIKKYHLTLQGDLTYAYKKEKLTFDGTYLLSGIQGIVRLEVKDKKFFFMLKSEEIQSITPALDLFPILPKVRVWLDKKVQAEKYKLLSLRGSGRIIKKGFILDYDHLFAQAVLYDATCIFHPNLAPVKSPEVRLNLSNRRLDMDFSALYYLDRNITGSKAALLHLGEKGRLELLLGLKVYSRYDKEIQKLMNTYKVKIPFLQKKGEVQTDVTLDIQFKKKKVKIEGSAFVSKGKVIIAGVPLSTNGGKVTFTSKKVALWDVDLYDSWYRANINGTIDFRKKEGDFKADIKYLVAGKKKSPLLKIKNQKKVSVKMNYSKAIQFTIPQYALKIKAQKKGGVEIVSGDINTLLPFIQGMTFPLSGGTASLKSTDYKRVDFKGAVKWNQTYLYLPKKAKNPINKIDFSGVYRPDQFMIKALSGAVSYDSKKMLLRIKGFRIDAQKLFGKKEKNPTTEIKKLTLIGNHCLITYGKYQLPSDQFELKVQGKHTTFVATDGNDRVRMEKNGKSIVLHANDISEKMLRHLLNIQGLSGGRYTLELLGDPDEKMQGVLQINGGSIKSFKAYNDLIALFNTIPALMTLSDPGFSKKGFVIRDGKIEFTVTPDRIVFDQIYLNGKSATIVGKGSVMIESGKLNIDLAIRTAREMGKVLGSLPIVGYILFGKDKSMTTGVKIMGTLDNPKAKTHPIQEALLYPFELIKRTLTSPAHIINQ